MEAMTWSEVSYRQAPLLKLSVAQESNRRDSLSSSRTGDSGYNSDPEISLSPLDFVGSDQGEFCFLEVCWVMWMLTNMLYSTSFFCSFYIRLVGAV